VAKATGKLFLIIFQMRTELQNSSLVTGQTEPQVIWTFGSQIFSTLFIQEVCNLFTSPAGRGWALEWVLACIFFSLQWYTGCWNACQIVLFSIPVSCASKTW